MHRRPPPFAPPHIVDATEDTGYPFPDPRAPHAATRRRRDGSAGAWQHGATGTALYAPSRAAGGLHIVDATEELQGAAAGGVAVAQEHWQQYDARAYISPPPMSSYGLGHAPLQHMPINMPVQVPLAHVMSPRSAAAAMATRLEQGDDTSNDLEGSEEGAGVDVGRGGGILLSEAMRDKWMRFGRKGAYKRWKKITKSQFPSDGGFFN